MPDLPERPNVVLIITDQERAPMHWPQDFVSQRLASCSRLLQNGVSFENATCNTSMCSPSRATFFTGLMPAQHGVVDTLTENGPVSPTETELNPELPNLGTMFKAAGYDVQYRGKWHLSKGNAGAFDVTADDLAGYGFAGWVPPDAGGDTQTINFGAGRADHDAAYIEQSLEFLRDRVENGGERPFCLIISLINPHDVLAFPRQWADDYIAEDFEGNIELPATVDEDLATNFKPTVQSALAPIIDLAVGKLETPEARDQYANFYANLVEQIDRQIAPIIDLFYDEDGRPTELGEETLIVRFSDHGELAMAHGGLRQKAFNVYEETLRVPLIFSNPRLPGAGQSCPHPASLLDLMPTLAGMVGIEPPASVRGADLSPLVRDPNGEPVQDAVMFTFDDMHAGTGLVPEILPNNPGRIRCIRERRFKYARYFDSQGRHPDEHEMYDLEADPLELDNLAHPEHPRYNDQAVASERERLAARLAEAEDRLAR
jgi:choline-sulfatase